jgi:hypothetical protein
VHFTFRGNHSRLAKALGGHQIQPGGAFQGGAARNVKKTAAIRRRELAVAFGQVQNDRSAGAIQLIAHRDRFGQRLQNWFKPGDESQGFLINAQFLMVEQGGVEE